MGTRQFVIGLPNRYEDILTALACSELGVVSKEVVCGVNAHRLVDSENPVPRTTDLCCVWSQEYADNIAACDRPQDIRVTGYPKYDLAQINAFQERYPRQALVTYMSQATYDIGPRYAAPVDDTLRARERDISQRAVPPAGRFAQQAGRQAANALSHGRTQQGLRSHR